MLTFGILDQSPLFAGEPASQALRRTIALAQAAEGLGYARFWVSEHHDTLALAGSSPEVLLAAIGAHTSRIRIGSAGVLLPHYSPFKVAENFRVLEALYPGRVDLGIGRAPGGMPIASQALGYGRPRDATDQFVRQLHELGSFLGLGAPFAPGHPFEGLVATPAVTSAPPVWLLGSSGYSAERAAELGAAFSFAHFINGEGGQEAVRRYMATYRPGPLGAAPRANVCVHVVCADTDDEAEELAAPIDLRLLMLEKGSRGRYYPTAEEARSYPYTEFDRMRMSANRKRMVVGGPERVKRQLTELAAGYGVAEIILVAFAHDTVKRLRSFERIAALFGLAGTPQRNG